jgi:hypothetical protein
MNPVRGREAKIGKTIVKGLKNKNKILIQSCMLREETFNFVLFANEDINDALSHPVPGNYRRYIHCRWCFFYLKITIMNLLSLTYFTVN